jgi:hypothetical protein
MTTSYASTLLACGGIFRALLRCNLGVLVCGTIARSECPAPVITSIRDWGFVGSTLRWKRWPMPAIRQTVEMRSVC